MRVRFTWTGKLKALFIITILYNSHISANVTQSTDTTLAPLFYHLYFVIKSPRYLIPCLKKPLSPNPEGAFHCFLAENHGLRLGSTDSHPSLCTLSCMLKVTLWWSQENHIIRKQQGCYSEVPKSADTLLLTPATPLDSAHENPKQNWRQESDTQ